MPDVKAKLLKKFEDEILALDKELKTELPREIKRARELGDSARKRRVPGSRRNVNGWSNRASACSRCGSARFS
jgi:hypothetical protein